MKILVKSALLSTLVVITGMIAAQGSPPAELWFSVTISTPETSVRAGSDVKLKVIFANDTEKDLHFGAGGPGRGGPVFDIDIRDSDDKPVSETPYGLKMHGKDPHPFAGSVFSATLHHGETMEEELILNKEYDLSKPGKYTVQVKERNPVFQTVKSNTIAITVIP
jgi:hypothetical protein